MDNIQSWSSFEQQHQNKPTASRHESPTSNVGVDALLLSQSSPNIPPSTASLLRQAGLSDDNHSFLKFHWMRPHPSLIFEIQDEMRQRQRNGEAEEEDDDDDLRQEKVDPAMEASRLMKAHRYAQENNMKDADDTSSSNSNVQTSNQIEKKAASLDLPMEMPKLRINLAGLVEPPLMTTWLPTDDDDDENT